MFLDDLENGTDILNVGDYQFVVKQDELVWEYLYMHTNGNFELPVTLQIYPIDEQDFGVRAFSLGFEESARVSIEFFRDLITIHGEEEVEKTINQVVITEMLLGIFRKLNTYAFSGMYNIHKDSAIAFIDAYYGDALEEYKNKE